MSKMLKILLSILTFTLLYSCANFNINDVDHVTITQESYIDGIKTEKIVYAGPAKDIDLFIKELSLAKRVWIGSVSKEALIEGEYIVELFSTTSIIGKYRIFSSENIYDELNDYFLKSELLNFIPNRNIKSN